MSAFDPKRTFASIWDISPLAGPVKAGTYDFEIHAEGIAEITYDLTVYDCATLFADSYHSKKSLLSRHLSATPTIGPLHDLTLPPNPY